MEWNFYCNSTVHACPFGGRSPESRANQSVVVPVYSAQCKYIKIDKSISNILYHSKDCEFRNGLCDVSRQST